MSLKPNWSNSKEEEEEEDYKGQNKSEEEIEDLDGNIEKQEELKKHELKNNNITIPQPNPKSQSISTSDTDMDETVVHTPQLTYTLVASGNGEQKHEVQRMNLKTLKSLIQKIP